MDLLSRLGSVTELASGETTSRARLEARISERAGALSGAGVRAGNRVLLLHANSASFFADFLACWKLGACAVPVDPRVSAPELANLISHSRARAIVRAAGLEAIQVAGGREEPLQGDLILYTSGTTGVPKGVVHTLETLSARWKAFETFVPLPELDRTLCVLPTYFGHGLIANSLWPLLNGKELFIAPENFTAVSAARLGAWIDQHEITFLSSVPAIWEMALPLSAPPSKGTLRRVHCASAPAGESLLESVRSWSGGARVLNIYGTTETATWIAELGKEAWGCDFEIRENGSVWVRTASLMEGYDGRAELTSEVVRDGWFDTGDSGRLSPAGGLILEGRTRFVINKAGMKVFPEEIDALLKTHPAISDACAFALPDSIGGQSVAAAIAWRGEPVERVALERWCAERILSYKIPTRWFALEKIDRSARGKVNRDAIERSCRGKAPL